MAGLDGVERTYKIMNSEQSGCFQKTISNYFEFYWIFPYFM